MISYVRLLENESMHPDDGNWEESLQYREELLKVEVISPNVCHWEVGMDSSDEV